MDIFIVTEHVHQYRGGQPAGFMRTFLNRTAADAYFERATARSRVNGEDATVRMVSDHIEVDEMLTSDERLDAITHHVHQNARHYARAGTLIREYAPCEEATV